LTSGESPLVRPGVVVVVVAVVEMVGGEVERSGSRGGQQGQGKPDKPEKIGHTCKSQLFALLSYQRKKICFLQESILPNFFFVKQRFFRFLILSLAILKNRQYFIMLHTLKLTNENWKSKEIKVW
jgi:hypothetical protein